MTTVAEWTLDSLTPDANLPSAALVTPVVINEVDADTPGADAAEFVELYDGGVGNTSLDGLVLVFFNGSNDLSYGAFDLDGFTTNAEGFFVLGNSAVPNVSLVFDGNVLQNGADAAALYQGNGTDFPNNTAVTSLNLIDAIVYDTSDSDDSGLLAGLGQSAQFDENANANGANEANSRIPDGTGTFIAQLPTPGTANQLTFDLQITEIWPGQSGTDLTADWFEITNVGPVAWVAGIAPDLFYSNQSTAPAEADLIQGLTRLEPGQTAVVVIGDAGAPGIFNTVWSPVIDLTGVEIGFTDGAGLGDGGDAVSLFVGGPAVNTLADLEAYPDTTGFDGVSYDLNLGAFSLAGANGAVATLALGGSLGTVPAVGSPGNGAPLTGTTITKIHQIQGNSANQGPGGAHNDVSPLLGQVVTIEGVVVGAFQGTDQLRGFFIQEETSDQDGDLGTSEGLFVFTGNTPLLTVTEGQLVRVTGSVSEFDGATQLSTTGTDGALLLQDGGNNLGLATPASLALPVVGDVDDYYEQFEGMLAQFPDKLVVSEYFELSRFGQVVLNLEERPIQYTQLDDSPTSGEFTQFLDQLNRRRIILDDDDNRQNTALPDGAIFYPQPGGLSIGTQGPNYFRGGDSITGLTAILNFGADAWRLRPTQANPVQFTAENPRPLTAPEVGGNIKVASFNVLNYFTTIDAIGGSGSPRGADSAEEFERQNQKLIAALTEIDADVFGFIEIENNGTTILELVNRLNAVLGAGTYAAIDTGVVGTDQITVAMIYKPAVLQPKGNFATLTDPAFTDPNGAGIQRNRPALAQTFEVVDPANADFGGVFNLVVNHFKSKGGSDATGLDLDQGDGQAQFNDTRTKAADFLVNTWLPGDPTGQGDADWLIIGDLNAYAGETPITTIKNSGYTDLINTFIGADAYSFLFSGQLGYLDYALANDALVPQVTGVAEWHINADEIPLFDYNNTVDDGAGEASFEAKPSGNPLFEANAFRTSDHDPVLVGLDLDTAPPLNLIDGTEVADRLRGTSAVDLIRGLGGNDRLEGREGDDILQGGAGNDTLLGQEGNDVLQGGEGNDRLQGGAGDDLLDGGAGRDTLASSGDGDFIATQTGVTGTEGTDVFINLEVVQLTGGLGNNTLDASALTSLQAFLRGGAGDDTLLGGQGRDTLQGEAGNDLLAGGLGKDNLTGGAGADSFDYRNLENSLLAGFDVIKDFSVGEDFLRVSQLPTLFTANAGHVTKLNEAHIQGILTPAILANPDDSAVFSFGSRIFVAINDGTAGFQKASDAVIELAVPGLAGSLSLANFTV